MSDYMDRLKTALADRYDVVGELGVGGMATVYLAREIALNRKVALKVMAPAVMEHDELIERFKREAQTAAALSHPHIIPIYGVGETDEFFFFFMKCVEGRTLRSVIDEIGAMPIEMVHAIMAQVGDALGYAHRQGVVHRDIKPDNIMIDNEGWAVITDFGIAKVTEARNLTSTGALVGTPAYMSPEQCSEEEITGASDQYSLGVVAYEMLTGVQPFKQESFMGMMWAHVNTEPPSVLKRRPEVPAELAAVVDRMLAKSPADRFGTMEDVVSAIGAPSMTRDDPIRTQMIGLAKAGRNAELAGKIRTPHSPVPLVAKTPTTPMPTHTWVNHRRKLLGASTTLAVVLGGWLAFTNLRPTVPTEEQLDPGPPAPEPPVAVVIEEDIPDVGSAATELTTAEPQLRSGNASAVASLEVLPSELRILSGGSGRLVALPHTADGTPKTDRVVTWTSNDASVASVDVNGEVVGVTEGTATITAVVDGFAAEAVVSVGAAPVQTVEIVSPSEPLLVGQSIRLEVIARGASGAALVGRSVAWSSADSNVARVTSDGHIQLIATGRAVVTASTEGVASSVTLVVANPATPDPRPDQRPLVIRVVRDYAAALQAHDIAAVKRVYPDWPRERERAWTDLFALRDLSVSVDSIDIKQITNQTATVTFMQTIEARQLESNTTSFVATLQRTEDGWRMVEIR